ncbi:MAG TPA: hypothetical protein DCM67_01645 [Propionibacteriaceae bacterium]|nr:hypothetical protein [Propionibacteriaceae bacterium]
MELDISESCVGQLATVRGAHWPAGQPITVTLVWAEQVQASIATGQMTPLAQTGVDGDGNFAIEVVVPAGQGWESGGQAAIVVCSSGCQQAMSAPLALVPPTATPEPPTATPEPPLPTQEPPPPLDEPPAPTEEVPTE